MASFALAIVITVLITLYPTFAQDGEVPVLYETPVYKVAFHDGFMVKVFSFDDVLDGVESQASQVAEFVLPLDAVPGATLVASALTEKGVTGNIIDDNTNTSRNDDDSENREHTETDNINNNNDRHIGANSTDDHFPPASGQANKTDDETREDTETGNGLQGSQSLDKEGDTFDEDVVIEGEQGEDARQNPTPKPFLSNEQSESLRQKVQEEVDKYLKERDLKTVENQTVNGNVDRQTTTSSFTIEALFVVDFSLYSQFLSRALNNPFTAMEDVKAFYSNIVQATNTRLATAAVGATSPFSLTLSLSAIVIAESAATSPWTEQFRDANLNVNPLLPSTTFNAFAAGLNPTFPHDMAVLFTGYTLVTTAGETQGFVPALSTLCSLIGNIWITDNLDERTSLYLARYIGDSLGIQRDGANGCDESNLNVMSSVTSLPSTAQLAPNPWAFSSCSAQEIRSQLPNNAFICTASLQNTAPFNTAVYTTSPFGQRFDADAQCQNIRRPSSRFCRENYYSQTPPFTAMCYNLLCEDTNGLCVQTIAHDGTSCGDRSFCQQGACVFSFLAPSTSANCPQLDNPRTTCTLGSCASPILAAFDCCGTCNSILDSSTPAF